jgi:hypothetical protein
MTGSQNAENCSKRVDTPRTRATRGQCQVTLAGSLTLRLDIAPGNVRYLAVLGPRRQRREIQESRRPAYSVPAFRIRRWEAWPVPVWGHSATGLSEQSGRTLTIWADLTAST